MIGDKVDALALGVKTSLNTDNFTMHNCNEVRDMPAKMLLGAVYGVKLDGGTAKDLELPIREGTAFMHTIE